ncbi:porin family protein [Chelativorans xinjiangense]|uniref:porin family protein n=1 Tax=Chelativorans xinjiangense TaxID=2681485 RepID=UPI001FE3B7D5|nr:porin family protein [Chelativorans xinjiangense]
MRPTINTSKNSGYHIMTYARDQFLRATSAIVAVMLVSQPSFAADWLVDDENAAAATEGMEAECVEEDCPSIMRGKMLDRSAVGRLPITPNLEQESLADQIGIPFKISVDGQVVDESGAIQDGGAFGVDPMARPVERQRKTDVDLSAVDIQLKFDGLDQKPLLNVSTVPVSHTFKAGEAITFVSTTNYPAFIGRAEIRIFRQGPNPSKKPIDIIPTQPNSLADWVMPTGGAGEYSYVLRVYDEEGRFDETVPLMIARTDSDLQRDSGDAVAPGLAEDRTAFRNIPIHGGAVTVYGRNVPEGYGIHVFNEPIPIDPKGAFVTQRILPPGDHVVDIAVDGPMKAGGLYFSRDVNIPDNEWFYVALADFTVGKRTGDPGIEDVRTDEYDKYYKKGRLAFYLKGKIKGKFLLTAAADTGENNIKSLFNHMGAKDAQELLRRIDPDKYYPVYGDDSTSVEDAPTQGKFYVRLERGDNHIMWGNYKTRIEGSRFLSSDRGLYGANAVYRSQGTTSFGERKGRADLYAALPDTLPQRDEFLGTGGSAYFLKRQDITIGSETISVETRDGVTGRLVERRFLKEGEDYTFDYLQGVIILKRPLSSSALGLGPVRDGALGESNQYLIVQYEYEPKAGDLDGYVYGGRVQRWLGDRLRIGVTGMNEKTGEADQQAIGADFLLRRSDTTYLEAEIAQSKGPGFGSTYSTDGGLTIDDRSASGGRSAKAWMVEGQADLADFNRYGVGGKVGAYYESKDANFSTITEQITHDRRTWGGHVSLPITGDVDIGASYDELRDDGGQNKRDSDITISWQFDNYWKASFGVSYTKLYSPQAAMSGKRGYDGKRMDAGIRVDYRQNADYLYYGFAQSTMERDGDIYKNDRYGLGAQVRLTEKIGVEGEVSHGNRGFGGLANLTYSPTVEDHYYIGYRLDPDRSFDLTRSDVLDGVDRGSIVGGVRKRIDDVTSAYAENNYDLFGRRRSLAQTYGVVYTPDAMWTVDGGVEVGRVMDDRIDPKTAKERSDFDRYAVSLAAGYNDEELGLKGRIRGEARFERSDDKTRDRNTYLLSSGGTWSHHESGRLLASVDAVVSDSDAGVFYDGDYVEASLGYAYRPALDDRLNALVRYTFLYDLPGNDQISSLLSGSATNGPLQRSHIVSADVTYDVLPWLSIGGKYGARFGQIRYRNSDSKTLDDDWQDSIAHLGILRTDLHIVKEWDALLEGRAFFTPDVNTVDYGLLAALYRHVGNNFKVGAGYNFGRFSDDLRDLTLDDRGPFLNVVGKF